jgi:hypothetical protein
MKKYAHHQRRNRGTGHGKGIELAEAAVTVLEAKNRFDGCIHK